MFTNRKTAKGSRLELKRYQALRDPEFRDRFCHAPFQALRFSVSGNIYTCCFNRFYSLGRFPQTSIMEAWQGEKMQLLRKALKAGDLSMGCHSCLHTLRSGNYQGIGALNYDLHPFRETDYPRLLDFELSNSCNLACTMCSALNSSVIAGQGGEVDVYSEDFIDQLKPLLNRVEQLRFSGGEPFLTESCYRIWEECSHLSSAVKIYVQTNGTIMNPRMAALYETLDMNVSFSLDSLDPEKYARIRKGASLERTLNNFHHFYELAQQKGREISVSFCLMNTNLQDFPEFFRYFHRLNVPVVLHRVVFPPELSVQRLKAEELKTHCTALKSLDSSGDGINQRRNAGLLAGLIRELESLAISNNFSENPSMAGNTEATFKDLEKRIAAYSAGTGITENGKAAWQRELREIITACGDEEEQQRSLWRLSLLPVEYLIAEMESCDQESIVNRMKRIPEL
jgi:MoaA/NifB/PqqE/SkfB family radical SAM enzyme